MLHISSGELAKHKYLAQARRVWQTQNWPPWELWVKKWLLAVLFLIRMTRWQSKLPVFFKKIHLLNGDVFLLVSCFFVEGIWSLKLQIDLKQQKILFNSWLVVSMCFRFTDFCLALCSSIFLCSFQLPRVSPFITIVLSLFYFVLGWDFPKIPLFAALFLDALRGAFSGDQSLQEIKHDLDLPLTQDASG